MIMIIPVFDVKDNMCVSGKSGARNTYSKLDSVYGDDIREIALNLKNNGFEFVYIADLDKIEGIFDNSELICEIDSVVPVLLDNGASSMDDLEFNKNICSYPILSTETMTSIEETYKIFKNNPYDNIILSVDIVNNELLVKNKHIKMVDIVRLINEVKPSYTILLNISQVGTKKSDDNTLINEVIQKTPYTQHIIGGGLTNKSIKEYRTEGINNFLVGTILHEGNLSPELVKP
ncbi:MAG: hypothetical protein BZ138_04720 [Methanosphaera sp. rholeuAM270]|nr:MAG: hypothetical protein BZ138_04720 [Methanosphaera sp. rholeuAM270]